MRACTLVAAFALAALASAQERAFEQDGAIRSASKTSEVTDGMPSRNSIIGAELTHRIIDAPNGTYGYEILKDGKLFVRQTSIPGRSGVEGCPSRQQAEDLASFVSDKIRAGAMPPTVSAEELKSLGL